MYSTCLHWHSWDLPTIVCQVSKYAISLHNLLILLYLLFQNFFRSNISNQQLSNYVFGQSGWLPNDVCNNMANIKTLNLGENEFEGHIPPNIRKCMHLKVLSLSFNNLHGNIPRQIGNMSMLRELYLGTIISHVYIFIYVIMKF